MSKTRSDLTIGDTVTKQYRDPALARHEIEFYQHLPFGHPQLLDADLDAGILVMEYHPPATPSRRVFQQLVDLLVAFEKIGVHHRDVHPGNIVMSPNGAVLLDWETAIYADLPSYDLYGPDSGVSVPDIHAALRSRRSPDGYRMWVASPHPASILSAWGIDIRNLI